jgi:hypothetical protein
VKKARYVFAAAGAAPALGLLAPAAIAAPTIGHAQARPAKTVRLSHAATTPHYVCHSGTTEQSISGVHRKLYFSISNYGHCVDAEHIVLHEGRATSVKERGPIASMAR